MGNCCKSSSNKNTYEKNPSSGVQSRITTKGVPSILICLDTSPTPETSTLKTALKGTFGHVVTFNNQRSVLNQMKSTTGYKYYIVIIGKIALHGLKSLVDEPNVVAIYLYFGKPHYNEIPNSPKIKGFYEHPTDLKTAIYNDA